MQRKSSKRVESIVLHLETVLQSECFSMSLENASYMHGGALLGLLPTIAKSCRLSACFLLCACASNVQQVTAYEKFRLVLD